MKLASAVVAAMVTLAATTACIPDRVTTETTVVQGEVGSDDLVPIKPKLKRVRAALRRLDREIDFGYSGVVWNGDSIYVATELELRRVNVAYFGTICRIVTQRVKKRFDVEVSSADGDYVVVGERGVCTLPDVVVH